MPKRLAVDRTTERAMKTLGRVIKQCRGDRSLRNVAAPSSIPASQLLAIENGTLAPTADVYSRLIDTLTPSVKQRDKMDLLYMEIRKTPPPDVCALIIKNPELITSLRAITLPGDGTGAITVTLPAATEITTQEGDANNGQDI